MANVNAPSGLSPVQYLNGSPYNGKARMYYIPATDTNAYAIGDPVATHSGAADANGVSAVTLATAGTGNAIRGVIVSCGGSSIYGGPGVDTAAPQTKVIPATKLHPYYVLVADDPGIIFEVQEYGSAYGAADVGKNANLKAGTNNGTVSGWTLDDTASSSTGSSVQVRLLGLVQRSNNAFGAYAKWLVKINNHEFSAGVAGV
jgi:hypothetical protein